MNDNTIIEITPLQDMENFPIKDNDKMDTISILSYTDLCSICYSKMENNSKTFSCSHTYHKNCINEWFKNNTTCPICRKNIINEIKKPQKKNSVRPIINQHELQIHIRRRREEIPPQRCAFINCITTNTYYVLIILLYLSITINNIVSIHISEEYINNYYENNKSRKNIGGLFIIMINMFYFLTLIISIHKNSKCSNILIIESLIYIIMIIIYTDYIKKSVAAYKELGMKIDNYLLVSFILYIIIMIYLYINMIIIKYFV